MPRRLTGSLDDGYLPHFRKTSHSRADMSLSPGRLSTLFSWPTKASLGVCLGTCDSRYLEGVEPGSSPSLPDQRVHCMQCAVIVLLLPPVLPPDPETTGPE